MSSNGHDQPLSLLQISSKAPIIKHFSPASQRSLLTRFAHTCTLIVRIRKFRDNILSSRRESTPAASSLPRTLEAFAEALTYEVHAFDRFVALKETDILRAHLQAGKSTPVSLLGLDNEFRLTYSSIFDDLVDIFDACFPNHKWLNVAGIRLVAKSSPSTLASRILDVIFEKIQERHAFGDNVTASFLLRVFMRTAEPSWQMLGRWLKDGIFMPMNYGASSKSSPLPAEFFIEFNELQLSDPDFWTDGFSLRSHVIHDNTSSDYEVPLFLKPLSEAILGAGKSIGFLRLLGHDITSQNRLLSSLSWPAFDVFLSEISRMETGIHDPDAILQQDLTTDKLTLLLSDHLLPICTESAAALKNVFFTHCDFPLHLERIEDVFLMKRLDVMADFCDILFNAVSGIEHRSCPSCLTLMRF